MFKRLIDASSFISLAGTKSLADRIVSRSPLTFNTPEKKEFLVHIFLTEKYFHKTHIRDSPIHGKWEIDRLDVWGQHTLSKNALPPLVPTGMGYRGLVDWESCGQLEELADPEEKHLLNDKELFQVREKRRQSLAQMESLIETWKLHTEEGRKAAPMLEKAGFGVSEKTKAKAFDVLEQAAIESQKVKDYGKASF
ncbi:hypothetical protein QBC38DRAFT_484494 [Podospora fimiseda]|uniref:Uncharacterized protein n=1 Tax=Podospora fimiseda TaxID=252190 RepID=A0AAN7H0D2_9PEZI|nr:hypothetical protein QBC38DRAFT_484494 [Podospora fimiseda]